MALISLNKPEKLLIANGTDFFYGADQEWYGSLWQRRAGCGPTVASMLAGYLAQTRSECEPLAEKDTGTKEGILLTMNSMWKYVTPGYRGVNATVILRRGLSEYAGSRGVDLVFRFIDIGICTEKRLDEVTVSEFLSSSMEHDRPVAFLNLHNGEETKLDRWHWVTLVAYDVENGQAMMYDQGKKSSVDILLWLRTTKLGGGFVTADAR